MESVEDTNPTGLKDVPRPMKIKTIIDSKKKSNSKYEVNIN